MYPYLKRLGARVGVWELWVGGSGRSHGGRQVAQATEGQAGGWEVTRGGWAGHANHRKWEGGCVMQVTGCGRVEKHRRGVGKWCELCEVGRRVGSHQRGVGEPCELWGAGRRLGRETTCRWVVLNHLEAPEFLQNNSDGSELGQAECLQLSRTAME